MMPMSPPGGPGGPPGGAPPGPGGPGGAPPGQAGAPGPAEIKQQLVMLLQKAKQLAEQNGIDWNQLMSSVGGGGVGKVKAPSAPPSPSAPPY